MIAVFVRHEHRVETLRIFTDKRETAGNFFCTHSRVDEHACIACNDQDRIPSGATAKNGNFHIATKRHKRHKAEEKSANYIRALVCFVLILWLDLEARTIDIEAIEISECAERDCF